MLIALAVVGYIVMGLFMSAVHKKLDKTLGDAIVFNAEDLMGWWVIAWPLVIALFIVGAILFVVYKTGSSIHRFFCRVLKVDKEEGDEDHTDPVVSIPGRDVSDLVNH